MPEDSRRGKPRATQLMIDVFHAIARCGDLIHYWDIAKHATGGVLLHASSRLRYASEEEALEVARLMAKRVQPPGYDTQTVSAEARTNGATGEGWHAFVEVLVEAQVGTVVP